MYQLHSVSKSDDNRTKLFLLEPKDLIEHPNGDLSISVPRNCVSEIESVSPVNFSLLLEQYELTETEIKKYDFMKINLWTFDPNRKLIRALDPFKNVIRLVEK